MKKYQSIISALVAIIMLISITSCNSYTPVESSTNYYVPSEPSYSTVQDTPEPTLEPTPEPTPEPQLSKFELKVQAEKNTKAVSMDNLLRNPYSYVDGNLYRFGGEITYINRNQDETVGYLKFKIGYDEATMNFTYPGWMDVLADDKIVVWGYITGMSESYLTFDISFYEIGGAYSLSGFSDELWNFILGGYHGEKANIELTRETIYGIPYTITEYQRFDAAYNLAIARAATTFHDGSSAEIYCLIVNLQGEDGSYYMVFDYAGNMSIGEVALSSNPTCLSKIEGTFEDNSTNESDNFEESGYTYSEDFTIDGTTLVKYGGSDKNVIVPEGITTIGEAAFYDNRAIETVVLPDTITEIGAAAFRDCRSLTKINFPEGLETIGYAAFERSKLEEITIPSTLKTVEGYGLNTDNGIGRSTVTGFQIAEGIEVIPSGVWDGFKQDTLHIPEGVTTIESYAFNNNYSNAPYALYLPSTIKIIEGKAFTNPSTIYEIEFGGTMAQWNEIQFGPDYPGDSDDSNEFQLVSSHRRIVCKDGVINDDA